MTASVPIGVVLEQALPLWAGPYMDLRRTDSGEFWSKGYFISAVGRHGNEAVMRQYVKQQDSDNVYKQLHRQDVQLELF